MNSLLNIFCYIISNVSIRKNLHRVQLTTESYPDRQDYSEKQCLLRTRGMERFTQSICGNQVKIPRISQMPNNQRHTSQAAFKLFPDQSGAIKSRFQES